MRSTLLSQTGIGLCVLALISSSAALAAPPDVSGNWKWTTEGRDGQPRESVLTLKQDGKNITGVLKRRNSETEIENAKLEADKLSFTVTRETQRGSFKANYTGKIEGDTLTGNVSMQFGDRSFEREWTAKREAPDITGTWAWIMKRDDGDPWEATLTLKRQDDKVVGAFTRPDSDWKLEIRNGRMEGSTLKFETVFQRDDGDSITIQNSAHLVGKTLKGKSQRTRDGETWSREWEATRQ